MMRIHPRTPGGQTGLQGRSTFFIFAQNYLVTQAWLSWWVRSTRFGGGGVAAHVCAHPDREPAPASGRQLQVVRRRQWSATRLAL